MTGYRISIGREQQITPRDIVGAFTNEAQLPIRSIGRIKIESQSSYIELSSNLPPRAIAKLGKLQIRHNHIGLKPESNPCRTRQHRRQASRFYIQWQKRGREGRIQGKKQKWDKKDKRNK